MRLPGSVSNCHLHQRVIRWPSVSSPSVASASTRPAEIPWPWVSLSDMVSSLVGGVLTGLECLGAVNTTVRATTFDASDC